MYKDEDYINMTAEQFVIYIRKTHPKYLESLPEKLQQWVERNAAPAEGEKIDLRDEIERHLGMHKVIDPKREQMRYEIFMTVIGNNKLVGANAETIADYAVEVTDALLKKFEE